MRSTTKTTALALTGAVALASGAYAIGTQADGGSASAGSDDGRSLRWSGPPPDGPGPPPGFDGLADELGVDADRLRDALRDFHEQRRGVLRDDFASALARALDVPVERAKSGLEELKERHRSRFAARLAEELGVEPDEVRAAFDELADRRPSDPFDFAEALADKLGLEGDAVARALWDARPGPPPRGHHPGPPLRDLAAALDVSAAQLREALMELRAGMRADFEERHEALVEFLARRLGLSTEKVEDALGAERAVRRAPRPPGPRPFVPHP